jgi:hypothetical protein
LAKQLCTAPWTPVLVRQQGFALRELHISEEEMELRLRQLALLLPDIAAKISVMKPQVM